MTDTMQIIHKIARQIEAHEAAALALVKPPETVTAENLLAHYRAAVTANWRGRWVARNKVYAWLRDNLSACWEARNTRTVKMMLDAIDRDVTGRADCANDWIGEGRAR